MQINATRQQALRAYHMARSRFFRLMGVPIGVILGLILSPIPFIYPNSLLGVFNMKVHAWLHLFSWQHFINYYPLQVFICYAVFIVLFEVIYLPVLFYLGYTLPRRYKIGTHPPRELMAKLGKRQAWFVIKWALWVQVLYALLGTQPLLWWLWMGLLYAVCGFLAITVRPSRIDPSCTVTSLPDGEVKQRLENLMERVAFRVEAILVIDKPGRMLTANAYVLAYHPHIYALLGRLGIQKNALSFLSAKPAYVRKKDISLKYVVAFSSTLLNTFPIDEIEVIMAHELGHLAHKDPQRRLLIRSIFTLISYAIIAYALPYFVSLPMYSFNSIADPVTMPFLLFALLTAWSFKSLIYTIFSREHEYQADDFALQATGMVAAFKNAMVRLANTNRVIAEPIASSSSTHPFISERIRRADTFAMLPADDEREQIAKWGPKYDRNTHQL